MDKKYYILFGMMGLSAIILYLLYSMVEDSMHRKALRACIDKIETIAAGSSGLGAVSRLDPGHKNSFIYASRFLGVSSFSNGIAGFNGVVGDSDLRGFIDVDGNLIFTFRGANIDVDFFGFDQHGRAKVYVLRNDNIYDWDNYKRVYGYVDCTGKVSFPNVE
jgi:hypothetical protein